MKKLKIAVIVAEIIMIALSIVALINGERCSYAIVICWVLIALMDDIRELKNGR